MPSNQFLESWLRLECGLESLLLKSRLSSGLKNWLGLAS